MLYRNAPGVETLESMLAERRRDPHEWNEPVAFDLALEEDRQRLFEVVSSGKIETTFDPLDEIASELFEIQHPADKTNELARRAFADKILAQGDAYGKWFLFPWSKELRRYPDKDEHLMVRTVRDRELDRVEEKKALYNSTVAVSGLSVGSNVLESLAQAGIGSTLIHGDFDTISPSNLNRITGNLGHVGEKKIDHSAINVSEIDPYIKQVLLRQGVNPDSMNTLLEHGTNLIFDEIDNITMKAALRLFAQRNNVPLVMATDADKRVIIDVERYDLGDVKPFGGALTKDEVQRLADDKYSPQEKAGLMIRIVGQENISPRLLESFMKVQSGELPGIPQLGITAKRAGALAVMAARQIILGESLASGRYVDDATKTLTPA